MNSRTLQIKMVVGLLVLLLCSAQVWAQIAVSGRVTDAETGEGIRGVTVSSPESNTATATDEQGYYEIRFPKPAKQIHFIALNYQTRYRALSDSSTQTIDVQLMQDSYLIDEVVVSGKRRYTNRNNPAVDLIREVIANKSANRLSRHPNVSYRRYEKINMAVSNVPGFIKNNVLNKDYRFVFDNIDTNLVEGRKLLPIYLEETFANHYRRTSPAATKRIVTDNQKTELDKRFVNNENLETYFKFLHNDVDIYDEDILILNRPFLSPTATLAPDFYKFYITDTLAVGNDSLVELTFVPRNEQDRLFSGKMQVSLDGSYAIGRADIWIGEKANINWINDIKISLKFDKEEDSGLHLLSYSDTQINFGLFGSGQGLFGQRTLVYQDYDITSIIPDSVFRGQREVRQLTQQAQTTDLWAEQRPIALSRTELNTYRNFDSLQYIKSFSRTLELGSILMTSFKRVGPFELGPLEYSYTYNNIEGNRFRLSGRTTRELSEKFYAEAYGAYGLRDQQWKYYGSAAYSLNGRRIGEYPAHYLQAVYHYDIREPGQRMDFRNGDSFTKIFSKGLQNNWIYNRIIRLNHVVDFGNHFLLQTYFRTLNQKPAAALIFENPDGQVIPDVQSSELAFDLRWAPGEEYFQRDLTRTPIINQYPVFNLRYNHGIKGLVGGEYDYQALRLDIFKRVLLSQLGLADVSLSSGYIWGAVPFALLDIPMSNQSHLLTPDSYMLMNDLEFVTDQFVKLSVEYRMQGFILNKIPLIKRLRMREIFGFKMLHGDLRNENRAEYSPNLFKLPVDSDGIPTTYTLSRVPYMEASVGIENILNFLRVEYVKRLSYLDHPNVDKGGLRFSVKLDF